MNLDPGGFGDVLRALAQERLAHFERIAEPLGERRAAAVALTLVADDAQQPCFVLTRRTERLNRHAGQWALPGGRVDPGETAEAAALRELEEEVGPGTRARQRARPARRLPDALGLRDHAGRGLGRRRRDTRTQSPRGRRDPPRSARRAAAPEVPRLRRIPESDRPVISIPLVDGRRPRADGRDRLPAARSRGARRVDAGRAFRAAGVRVALRENAFLPGQHRGTTALVPSPHRDHAARLAVAFLLLGATGAAAAPREVMVSTGDPPRARHSTRSSRTCARWGSRATAPR